MTVPSASTAWIVSSGQFKRADVLPRLRLFCFPHAGGGASTYLSWLHSFPADIEVGIVQLPGRENRMRERPFTEFVTLIDVLAEVLKPYLTVPFAFFGHSMGALLSFGLARRLRTQRLVPVHVFVSAYRAPQMPLRGPLLHTLPEAELVNVLLNLQGTQREILENEELRAFFLPLLRADFAVCETYVHTGDEPLSCPITAFGGLQDNRINRYELECWREQTNNRFELRMFSGGHFFLHSQREALADIMVQEFDHACVHSDGYDK